VIDRSEIAPAKTPREPGPITGLLARPGNLWRGRRCSAASAQAKELGWFVSVADGRSHFGSTRARFPQADALSILPIKDCPAHSIG
jgi:hypothetical protein